MESKRIVVDQRHPDPAAVRKVADVLAEGGVAVVPTDSVYGLCCAAVPGNGAHRRIFEIKQRPEGMTLPVFVADGSDLARYAEDVPVWAQRLADAFWPGALTLVVKASAAFPAEYAQAGTGTVALRVPDCEFVRALVREAGPLAQTSANTHGAPSATSGAEIEERLYELADIVADGGPAPLACASTLVDCTKGEPAILREGAITAAQIEAALAR